jgi:hypothetical protein
VSAWAVCPVAVVEAPGEGATSRAKMLAGLGGKIPVRVNVFALV